MSVNTCNIAYDDIPDESGLEFNTTVAAPHLVVLQGRQSATAATLAPTGERVEVTAVHVTGCLSVAF